MMKNGTFINPHKNGTSGSNFSLMHVIPIAIQNKNDESEMIQEINIAIFITHPVYFNLSARLTARSSHVGQRLLTTRSRAPVSMDTGMPHLRQWKRVVLMRVSGSSLITIVIYRSSICISALSIAVCMLSGVGRSLKAPRISSNVDCIIGCGTSRSRPNWSRP